MQLPDFLYYRQVFSKDDARMARVLTLLKDELARYQDALLASCRRNDQVTFARTCHRLEPHLDVLHLDDMRRCLHTVRAGLAIGKARGAHEQLSTYFTHLQRSIDEQIAQLSPPRP